MTFWRHTFWSVKYRQFCGSRVTGDVLLQCLLQAISPRHKLLLHSHKLQHHLKNQNYFVFKLLYNVTVRIVWYGINEGVIAVLLPQGSIGSASLYRSGSLQVNKANWVCGSKSKGKQISFYQLFTYYIVDIIYCQYIETIIYITLFIRHRGRGTILATEAAGETILFL